MLKLLKSALFGAATLALCCALNVTVGHADEDADLDRTLPPALCHTVHGRQVCDYLIRCQPAQVIDQSGLARLIYADIGCAQERARLGE